MEGARVSTVASSTATPAAPPAKNWLAISPDAIAGYTGLIARARPRLRTGAIPRESGSLFVSPDRSKLGGMRFRATFDDFVVDDRWKSDASAGGRAALQT